MFDDETPVAWTAMPRQAPVVGTDGSEIGVAERWLGDLDEDIFHGVVVKRHPGGDLVQVPVARIKRMTEHHVITDLSAEDAASLPSYR